MDDDNDKKVAPARVFFFAKNMFLIRVLLLITSSCPVWSAVAFYFFSVLEPLFQPSLGKQECAFEEKYWPIVSTGKTKIL